MAYQKEIVKVSDIGEEFVFVSDSQDVKEIWKEFPKTKNRYSSFFVSHAELDHGEITFVYGLTGTVPYIWVNCFLVKRESEIYAKRK